MKHFILLIVFCLALLANSNPIGKTKEVLQTNPVSETEATESTDEVVENDKKDDARDELREGIKSISKFTNVLTELLEEVRDNLYYANLDYLRFIQPYAQAYKSLPTDPYNKQQKFQNALKAKPHLPQFPMFREPQFEREFKFHQMPFFQPEFRFPMEKFDLKKRKDSKEFKESKPSVNPEEKKNFNEKPESKIEINQPNNTAKETKQ